MRINVQLLESQQYILLYIFIYIYLYIFIYIFTIKKLFILLRF